jgi:SAM-dependent methyltransferase
VTHGEPVYLDVRPVEAYVRGHAAAAASIPLEELEDRVHELPPAGVTLVLLDDDDRRLARALEWFAGRRHVCRAELPGERAALPVVAGPSRVRLWRPHALLERAVALAQPVAPGAIAIDVACGSGRDAVYLAEQGYAVRAVDHFPDALARARALAGRSGVHIETVCHDVEADPALGVASSDLVCVFYFLWRPLFAAIRAVLRPGGLACIETFHARERERSGHPRRERFVLQQGELEREFPGFEVLESSEGENPAGRYVSRLIARRPS